MHDILQAVADTWRFLFPKMANLVLLGFLFWFCSPSVFQDTRKRLSREEVPSIGEAMKKHGIEKLIPYGVAFSALFLLTASSAVSISAGTYLPGIGVRSQPEVVVLRNTDSSLLLKAWLKRPDIEGPRQLGYSVASYAYRAARKDTTAATTLRYWDNKYNGRLDAIGAVRFSAFLALLVLFPAELVHRIRKRSMNRLEGNGEPAQESRASAIRARNTDPTSWSRIANSSSFKMSVFVLKVVFVVLAGFLANAFLAYQAKFAIEERATRSGRVVLNVFADSAPVLVVDTVDSRKKQLAIAEARQSAAVWFVWEFNAWTLLKASWKELLAMPRDRSSTRSAALMAT